MHLLSVDHPPRLWDGEMHEEDEEEEKEEFLGGWGGLPAFTAEQRHLEEFTSALTQSGTHPNVTSLKDLQNPLPWPHICTHNGVNP